MKKTFKFGKIAFYNRRKINEVDLEVDYTKNSKGQDCFSVCGSVWNSKHTDIVAGGQCLESLVEYLGNNKTFKTIYGLWKRNHLNDMTAYANDVQGEAVDLYLKLNNNVYDYDKICEYLKEQNLYEVIVDGKKCRYGAEWYYKPISQEDKKTIENLMKIV